MQLITLQSDRTPAYLDYHILLIQAPLTLAAVVAITTANQNSFYSCTDSQACHSSSQGSHTQVVPPFRSSFGFTIEVGTC